MVSKYLVIEVVLLAEVTPRMRQDLSLLIITNITILDMILERLGIVEFLLSNED